MSEEKALREAFKAHIKERRKRRQTVLWVIASPFIAVVAFFVLLVISEADEQRQRQEAWKRLRQLNPGLPTMGGPGKPPKVIENPHVPKDLPARLGRARVMQNPHFPSQ